RAQRGFATAVAVNGLHDKERSNTEKDRIVEHMKKAVLADSERVQKKDADASNGPGALRKGKHCDCKLDPTDPSETCVQFGRQDHPVVHAPVHEHGDEECAYAQSQ